MAENIHQRMSGMTARQQRGFTPVLDALIADNAALRASILALTAKLDADATVTDTDYAATINPPAATATS